MRGFVLLTTLVAGLSAPIRASAAEPPLLGYVNLQRAILEVDEGKRAKANLQKTFEKKQSELSKRENELKALKEAIEKQTVVKDDAASRQQKIEFQTKLMELQQTFMKEQQELQASEAKELSAITDKMRVVIQEIGKAGNYTLILEIQENRLLHAKPHLNLTNEVIRKYNQKHK